MILNRLPERPHPSILTLSFLGIGQVLSRMSGQAAQATGTKHGADSGRHLRDHPYPLEGREVISLTRAFNKMLKELDLRRQRTIRTEKLASLGTSSPAWPTS
ncbi:MAG: hypothetical protein U0411_13955 [Thermodesulfovibrionales bacterium]